MLLMTQRWQSVGWSVWLVLIDQAGKKTPCVTRLQFKNNFSPRITTPEY
jgi:hypothetical protein